MSAPVVLAVRRAMYEPAAAYACEGLAPCTVAVPSPKFHARSVKVTGCSGALLGAAGEGTVWPGCGACSDTVARAIGTRSRTHWLIVGAPRRV